MDIEPLAGREHFPAVSKSTYLNAASIALMYKGASEAAVAWQRDLAQNGTLSFNEAAEQNIFSGLHDGFARLIGAHPGDIAVGSSFTELVASLAWAMMPARGENIVGVDVVFPSTIYPWLRVAHTTGCQIRLLPTTDYYADQEELVGLIDDNTAVVAISHVEFGSGQRYDLRRLSEVAHSHGALLVVDATQSAGAIPIVSARFPDRFSRTIVDFLKEQGVIVSPRADFVRFSPHLYNSSDDIDLALEVLDRAGVF